MPTTNTNHSETGKMHVVVESALKAYDKTREAGNAPKVHEEIQKIRKELDDLRKQQAETVTEFRIQKAAVAFWNKIEAILVPVLSAAVFGLASWVWQSEGKIGGVEMRVSSIQAQVESMEARTRSGTADRYTRTHAEEDHKILKEDIYRLLESYRPKE